MADALKKPVMNTGRRKEAIARVRVVTPGKGKIIVNGRSAEMYFTTIDQKISIKRPLVVADMVEKADIIANVSGGGISGQAGAISLGIARGLLELDPTLRPALKKEGLLTRDPRSRERKKYGRKGARSRLQWTKR